MEDPLREIDHVTDMVPGAKTAGTLYLQIDAFENYYTRDASFLHPLAYVPPGDDSRKRVIGLFLFYRALVREATFQVQAKAIDPDTLSLYVDLIQTPHFRFIPFAPDIPMHIHLHLRKIDGLYYIDHHEDVIQPRSLLVSLPVIRHFAVLFYFICEMAGLLSAYIFIWMGVWRPDIHLRKQDRDRKMEMLRRQHSAKRYIHGSDWFEGQKGDWPKTNEVDGE